MNLNIAALVVVAFGLNLAGAEASTTWNTTGSYSTISAGTTQYEGLDTPSDTNTTPYGNQVQFSSNGLALNAEAFFWNISSNINIAATSKTSAYSCTIDTLCTGSLQVYNGAGYGIGDTSYTSGQYLEQNGVAPGHTVDNQGGVYDAVAFQLPSSGYAVSQLVLNTFSTSQYASGNSDVTLLIGGNSLSSLSGLGGLSLNDLTGSYGFTELNYTSGSGSNIALNINPSNLTGKYLLVVASLTNPAQNDDFKIASLVAGTSVPEPSTLAMFLGVGIILIAWRRRQGKFQ